MAAFLLAIAVAAYVGMDHVLSRVGEEDGEKPVEVAADALYRELQADLPAAELKYRNKLVRLSGPSARAGKGPHRAGTGP